MVCSRPCKCVLVNSEDVSRHRRLFGLEPRGRPRSCWATDLGAPRAHRSVVDRLLEDCTSLVQARFREDDCLTGFNIQGRSEAEPWVNSTIRSGSPERARFLNPCWALFPIGISPRWGFAIDHFMLPRADRPGLSNLAPVGAGRRLRRPTQREQNRPKSALTRPSKTRFRFARQAGPIERHLAILRVGLQALLHSKRAIMPQRVLLAGLFHETHTFLEGRMGLAAFEERCGAELWSAESDGSPLAGVLEIARQSAWEVVPVIDLRATPGPTVDDCVVDRFWTEVSAALHREESRGLDGVYLVLH